MEIKMKYKVMIQNGSFWVKGFSGDYATCQWWCGTQRRPTRVEHDV